MEQETPSIVRSLIEGWKRIARKIGDAQARILLTLFYLFIVGPFALGIRWFGDPLGIKNGTPRGWRPRPNSEIAASIERANEQF